MSQPPRDQVQRLVHPIWAEVLGAESVGIDDDFFERGGDEHRAKRLCARVSDELGLEAHSSDLAQAPTLARFVEALRDRFRAKAKAKAKAKGKGGGGGGGGGLVPLAHGEATPIFFVHPWGGSAMVFAPLSRHFTRSVYAFDAPGIYGDEPVLTSIAASAATYVSQLSAESPEGPSVVAGFGAGGLIALEMARLLLAKGRKVGVVLIETMGPAMSVDLSDANVERIGHMSGLPGGLAVARAQIEAVRAYRYEPYEGPALLLRARSSPDAWGPEGDGGWKRLGPLTLHEIDGPPIGLVLLPRARETAKFIGDFADSLGA